MALKNLIEFAEHEPTPPKEWVELFLAVADLCDGSWDEDIDRELVTDAYNKLLGTKLGHRIYSEAIDARNAEVFGR